MKYLLIIERTGLANRAIQAYSAEGWLIHSFNSVFWPDEHNSHGFVEEHILFYKEDSK